MSTATYPITKKGGKGNTYGVVSEVSAILTVRPGHLDEPVAACERFHNKLKKAPEHLMHRFGLRNMRHIIFDGGKRMVWITTFETDWDPYIDDSVNMFGAATWVDWIQHTEECPDDILTFSNEELKAF